MTNRILHAAGVCIVSALLTTTLSAQTANTPKRDLTGIWAPLRTNEGIGGNGPLSARADGDSAGTANYYSNFSRQSRRLMIVFQNSAGKTTISTSLRPSSPASGAFVGNQTPLWS